MGLGLGLGSGLRVRVRVGVRVRVRVRVRVTYVLRHEPSARLQRAAEREAEHVEVCAGAV